mmetsp:Transcript_47498/g.122999  ORF Transcript_47498/g.122999 Transcript_47498/m.122999 type:complete len:126 (+) Transcript_47498:1034-1411(+)
MLNHPFLLGAVLVSAHNDPYHQEFRCDRLCVALGSGCHFPFSRATEEKRRAEQERVRGNLALLSEQPPLPPPQVSFAVSTDRVRHHSQRPNEQPITTPTHMTNKASQVHRNRSRGTRQDDKGLAL